MQQMDFDHDFLVWLPSHTVPGMWFKLVLLQITIFIPASSSLYKRDKNFKQGTDFDTERGGTIISCCWKNSVCVLWMANLYFFSKHLFFPTWSGSYLRINISNEVLGITVAVRAVCWMSTLISSCSVSGTLWGSEGQGAIWKYTYFRGCTVTFCRSEMGSQRTGIMQDYNSREWGIGCVCVCVCVCKKNCKLRE